MKKENKMLSIRKLALIFLAVSLLPCFGIEAGNLEPEINGLNIVPSAGKIRLEISKVGDIEFKAFMVNEPDRLVVDCIGARYDLNGITGNAENPYIYRVRTSQYQVEPRLISRIVIDLKQKVKYQLFNQGDIQVVEITGNGESLRPLESAHREKGEPLIPVTEKRTETAVPATAKTLPAANLGPVFPLLEPAAEKEAAGESKPAVTRAAEAPVKEKAGIRPAEMKEVKTASSPWIKTQEVKKDAFPGPLQSQQSTVPAPVIESVKPSPAVKSPPAAESLPWSESYVRGAPASGSGMPMGSRKITIDAQGADIKTVLRTISDFAGVNIVSGKDVKGDVYVHIKDCPWEEALDILLKAHGYGYREEYGMIRVAEMSSLMKEELDQKTAARKGDDLLPLETRIIFVNNSDAKEMKDALQNIVSSRGQIDVDLGSNSLVVTDIEKNLDKIEGLVKSLDKKTFQVDINAKLVELDVEAARELGVNWGVMNFYKRGVSGSADVNADITNSVGNIRFGTVRSWGELNAIIQMLEKSNQANIISNPRITTMDNREASILVGKEIPLIVADEAGNPITELTKVGIMLKVVPHVNTDRTITLDLHPEVSELQSESTSQGGVIIATAEADTRVNVNNGETAVIGGLIKKVDTEVIEGIPFLKDIPFLGRAFSKKSTANKKQELVIFVTPTIVE
ncbi:MAG: AMIN domain-containing protein [Candidatus Krumholzibacteriota bacterium]|nr:AMIN domain-containing protein [Candidatus Krumholzibacteriota bacterium]